MSAFVGNQWRLPVGSRRSPTFAARIGQLFPRKLFLGFSLAHAARHCREKEWPKETTTLQPTIANAASRIFVCFPDIKLAC